MKGNIYLTFFALICCCFAQVNCFKEGDEFLEYVSDNRDAIKVWATNAIFSTEIVSPRLDYIDCPTCVIGLNVIKLAKTLGVGDGIITGIIIGVCQILQIVEDDICVGIIRSYADPILRIVQEKPDIKTDDFCGLLIPGCRPVNSSFTDWATTIDQEKPPMKQVPNLPVGIPSTKILQFTDIHLDLDYVPNTVAHCGRPAGCCRDGDPGDDVSNTAGKFGHYNCALAPTALDALYEHAKENHADTKYIFLTGDFVHSAVWEYSPENNGKNIEHVTKELANSFPGVPVFPVIGNHEPDVVNMFPPQELWGDFDLAWMYNIVAEPFLDYIPTDQLQFWRKGGYYAVDLKEDNLRLVVVNTNLCYLQNFWLVYDTHDPTGQLQWFSDTMLQAEKDGVIVYILGHIMPGSGSCWSVWSEKFNGIVNRYEAIIKAQFYGHSHNEYFSLYFEKGTNNPTNALFVGPSGVPDAMSPAYKAYYADGARGESSTWELIDHETYKMDIAKSNEADEPQWEKFYSAKEFFNLKSLRPSALYEFVKEMIYDDDLFHKYWRTYRRDSDRFNPCQDPQCKVGYLCNLVTTDSGDDSQCKVIQELLDEYMETSTRPPLVTDEPIITTEEAEGTSATGLTDDPNPRTTDAPNPTTTDSATNLIFPVKFFATTMLLAYLFL